MSATAHRILSRAAGKSVRVGDRVEVALDRGVLSGARVPATLIRAREIGKRPWSSDDLLLTMDFQAPEVESEIPRSRALCREVAQTFDLRHVFDLNAGIGSQVVLESGLVQPGHLLAGSGRCLGVTGGVGALGIRLDEETLAEAIGTGRIEIQVPPAVRVDVRGRSARQVGPWDVAAAVSGSLGSGLAGRVIEFSGDSGEWGVDFRIGLCGLLLEMGVFAALVRADTVVEKFYKERGVGVDVEAEDDPLDEAEYEAVVPLEAEGVGPVSAPEYKGPHAALTPEGGLPVHGVFIGSCYGGRYEDMAIVAEVLKKEGQVHPDVRLVVSPATLDTARACLAAGFYETFLNTGAMVVVPGGGAGSAAGGAIFGDGERIASTAEYHRHLHPGQGIPEVHIVSPASAAVAAATGKLTDPARSLA